MEHIEGHEHEHPHTHTDANGNTYEHTHEHTHSHDHDHSHEHDHGHEHTHDGGADGYKKVRALVQYMVDHNAHHVEELAELQDMLPEEARRKLQSAIGVFDAANLQLRGVLDALDKAPEAEPEAHDHADDHEHAHGHDHDHDQAHAHVHDPKEKRRQIGRLARVIGHLEYVRRMLEADEDCAQVLMQISASRSALNGLGKEIINDHIEHCITHAIEEGDTAAVDEFREAIQKFI